MPLPRPTNTGTLVSAAIVGLLGFGACLFIKYGPKNHHCIEYVPKILALTIDPKEEENEPAETLDDSPQGCARQLQEMEKQLSPLCNLWRKDRRVSQDDWLALEGRAARAEELNEIVQSDPDIKPKLKRYSQLVTLSSTFKIAQIDEGQTEVFFSVSNSIIESSKIEIDVARAAGLQLVLKNDFRRPDHALMIRSLTHFSEEYESVQAEVDVYRMFAKELSFYGHEGLAQQILRLGIKQYDGRQVHRLIQLLK